MARHLRVEFSGAICHVTCRMIGDSRLERSRLFSGRRRDSELRAVAAHCLMRYAGQTQREVARFLEAGSGSAISKQLTRSGGGMDSRRCRLTF